jgi:hypothetical protein
MFYRKCAMMLLALNSCGQAHAGPPGGGFPPYISWTASWVQGTQGLPGITFPAVGETATITIVPSTSDPAAAVPYDYSSTGNCIKLSAPVISGATETVVATSINTGECYIGFSKPGVGDSSWVVNVISLTAATPTP